MPFSKPVPTRCLLMQTVVPVLCRNKPFIPMRLQNWLPILLQKSGIHLSVGQWLRTEKKCITTHSRLRWGRNHSLYMPCGKQKSIPSVLMQTVAPVKLFHKTWRQMKRVHLRKILMPIQKKGMNLPVGRLPRMVRSFIRIRQVIPWGQSLLTHFMLFGNRRTILFRMISKAVPIIRRILPLIPSRTL